MCALRGRLFLPFLFLFTRRPALVSVKMGGQRTGSAVMTNYASPDAAGESVSQGGKSESVQRRALGSDGKV